MEDNNAKILQFIRQKGPILPVEVAKHINSDTLMSSAHLSELSSSGKLKISNVKVGGSPLYYIPGQEPQLQNFADNLHEKEKKAYDLLSQKKVLRDSEIEPVIRVALRAIKDYAVALQVNFKGTSHIFWRWYLLSNKDAEELIMAFFEQPKPTEKVVDKENKPEQKITSLPKEITKPIPEPEVKKSVEEPTRVQKTEEQKIKEHITSESKEPKKEAEEQKEIQKPLEKKRPVKKDKIDKNQFLDVISNYFNKNNITLLSKEVIRKSEIDFTVQVPSAVGKLEYYCKAKDKKKINDTDLASAFAQGQLRKLPVLFLTNGDLTKRAKEMLQKDFKGVSITKL
ncbi:MAG: hypothetical protein U9O94_04825 [Nanoarchaeota archaeon]|nr:hypothetical protein [Nanoarchaeota archaeon]